MADVIRIYVYVVKNEDLRKQQKLLRNDTRSLIKELKALTWLPNSPDPGQMEYLWDILEKSPINRSPPQRSWVRSSMGQSQVGSMEAPLWIRHVMWVVDEFIRNISDFM